MWSFSSTTRFSFIYFMLVCPLQGHARMSSSKYQKHVDLSTEDSMLERESQNNILMSIDAVDVYSSSNASSDESESENSFNEITTKNSIYLKRQNRQLSSCLKTDAELRSAVKAAPKAKSTNIILCDKLLVSSNRDSVSKMTGIDITNKVINLSCNLSSNKRCNLDGGYKSRIFYGSNAKLSVAKVNFVKASTINDIVGFKQDGGALYLTGNSSLCLDRSSFMNNAGGNRGGAINLQDSSLEIKGGITRSDASIFSNNSAYEYGAIYASFSKVTAEKGIVIFKSNNAVLYSGAVGIYDSSVKFKNVRFFQNTAQYFSAASISNCKLVKLENVVFVNNTHDSRGALNIAESTAELKNVSFIDNIVRDGEGASLHVYESKVNLTNCIFNRNVIPDTESGANIYINEDAGINSYVSCLSNNNVFCNGLGSNSIFGTASDSQSTNCKRKGIAGKPGKGGCV